MLRITHSTNAAGAAKYFDEGLAQGDYYANQPQAIGKWGGRLADRLGLQGEVKKADFVALSNNQKPGGGQLNPRHSDTRKVGYDFTFSVPKSVSLTYAMQGDERIRNAFEQSVEETMQELESDIRIQEGQGKDKRLTKSGEMIWAGFTHQTSRPVDGVPDPHLHRHCFAMNVSWNKSLQRFQAAEFSSIKRTAPYYEAAFDSRMAMRLKAIGYSVERRGLSYEIKGIEEATLAKFSRRTAEVEKQAQKEFAKQGELSAKQKSQLGALTRAKKAITLSWEKLREIWRSWLSDDEAKQIEQAKGKAKVFQSPAITSTQAMQKAEAHLFERKSVVKAYQLKAEALKRSFGELLPEAIERELAQARKRGDVLEHQNYNEHWITTRQALQEEQQMLRFVRQSKGCMKPIHSDYEPQATHLTDEQKAAILHVMKDSNQVTLISGGAGTGKTTLMREVQRGIHQSGKTLHAFAPSAAASRGVQRKEGFANADTLASLLQNPEKQRQMKGGIIWVDEAGLMGVKDMNKLFAIAKQQKARVLLTGDVRQHSSVSRGDALRLLEKEGGMRIARVTKIQRQRQNPRYKQAVALAARGEVDKALHQLDVQGNVVEMGDSQQRLHHLVEDVAEATQRGKSTLIVSPTHREGQEVTTALREHLQARKMLGESRRFTQYRPIHWTEEQKQDGFSYRSSSKVLRLQFHQNAKGYRKGESWQVAVPASDQPPIMQRGEESQPVPLSQAQRFSLYEERQIELAVGDKIRITQNTKSKEGTRLHNGSIYRISGFTKQGDIKLHTGKTLRQDFGHLDYGYVRTSHSSQGLTVDEVFIAQSSQSVGASSQQQFYVSLSRGRQRARIYTDNKRELEQAVMRDGSRFSAREIAELEQAQRRQQSRKHPSLSPQKSRNHGNALSL